MLLRVYVVLGIVLSFAAYFFFLFFVSFMRKKLLFFVGIDEEIRYTKSFVRVWRGRGVLEFVLLISRSYNLGGGRVIKFF